MICCTLESLKASRLSVHRVVEVAHRTHVDDTIGVSVNIHVAHYRCPVHVDHGLYHLLGLDLCHATACYKPHGAGRADCGIASGMDGRSVSTRPSSQRRGAGMLLQLTDTSRSCKV